MGPVVLAALAHLFAAPKLVDLGTPVHLVQGSLGANFVVGPDRPGGIGLLRWTRRTHFTFHDLQLSGFLVPWQGPGEMADTRLDYFGLIRFKTSERSFAYPRAYDWSTYSVKTSSYEDLRLRAVVETGYGAFLLERERTGGLAQLNLELGAVFDYADLEAYSRGVSTGYGKGSLEADLSFGRFSGKAYVQYFQQVVGVAEDTGDQSHLDVEAQFFVAMNRRWRIAAGVLHTFFPRLDETLFDQPTRVSTLFLALVWAGGTDE